MKSSFPSFLGPAFDVLVLESLSSSVAVLDPAGRMLWVNGSWQRNAVAEGIAPSSRELAHGYYEGIAAPLRGFYEQSFARALATNVVFDQIYDCSSPTKRRVYHCRVLPIHGKGLVVEHSRVVDVDLDGISAEAWAETYVQTDGVLRQCSYCKRVRGPTSHAWDWMSPWAAQPSVRTSHVICPLCERFFWGKRLDTRIAT